MLLPLGSVRRDRVIACFVTLLCSCSTGLHATGLAEALGFDPLADPLATRREGGDLLAVSSAMAKVEVRWRKEASPEAARDMARVRAAQGRYPEAIEFLEAARATADGAGGTWANELDVLQVRRALAVDASPLGLFAGAAAAARLEDRGFAGNSGWSEVSQRIGLGFRPAWTDLSLERGPLAWIDWLVEIGLSQAPDNATSSWRSRLATAPVDQIVTDLLRLDDLLASDSPSVSRSDFVSWVRAYRRNECEHKPTWLDRPELSGLPALGLWLELVVAICQFDREPDVARASLRGLGERTQADTWVGRRVLWMNGVTAAIAGDADTARSLYETGLGSALTAGDHLAVAGLEIALAEIELETSAEPGEVAPRLIEALRASRGLDPRRRFAVLHIAAESMRRARNANLSKRIWLEVQATAVELGPAALSEADAGLARALADLGELDEARRILHRARERVDLIPPSAGPSTSARIRALEAHVALEQGDENFGRLLDQARTELEALGHRALSADLAGGLGRLLAARGLHDEARRALGESLRSAQNLLDRHLVLATARALELDAGDVDAAVDAGSDLGDKPSLLLRSALANGGEEAVVLFLPVGRSEIAVIEVSPKGSFLRARAEESALLELGRGLSSALELQVAAEPTRAGLGQLRRLLGLDEGARSVTVILPASLWILPVEEVFGVESTVTVAPAIEFWLAFAPRDPRPKQQRIGWAVGPAPNAGLPAGRDEIAAVTKLWLASALDLGPRPGQPVDILHVVGHGDHEDGSRLSLGDGQYFSLGDVDGWQPGIVVLNGCRTLGRERPSPLATRLPGGAMVLGTTRVIDDTAARDFGIAVQHHLANGSDLGSAVMKARSATLSQSSSLWSAYRMLGRLPARRPVEHPQSTVQEVSK